MPDKKFYEIEGYPEGLIWLAQFSNRNPEPYCKEHTVKLVKTWVGRVGAYHFSCPKDNEVFFLNNTVEIISDLARQEIFETDLKELEIVRIDPGGYQVLAKESIKKDPRYWIEAKLSDTSKGLQLMVQAGKRDGDGKKVQLFVEPPSKRLGFDKSSKDQHPNGLFTEVKATFKDSTSTIEES
jgi:hypothetical protein